MDAQLPDGDARELLLFCGFGMLPSLLPLHFHDSGAPEQVIGFVACAIMRPLVELAILFLNAGKVREREASRN